MADNLNTVLKQQAIDANLEFVDDKDLQHRFDDHRFCSESSLRLWWFQDPSHGTVRDNGESKAGVFRPTGDGFEACADAIMHDVEQSG